jgi:hypothetical protein
MPSISLWNSLKIINLLPMGTGRPFINQEKSGLTQNFTGTHLFFRGQLIRAAIKTFTESADNPGIGINDFLTFSRKLVSNLR